jgi:GTP cyclohydrolase FolE2
VTTNEPVIGTTSTGLNRPPHLAKWLDWVGLTTCPCTMKWARAGRLHGVDMGNEWVRTSTDPTCPHHQAKGTHR